MTTAPIEVICMSDRYTGPGPCFMCDVIAPLRPLPDSPPSQGICEPCDRIRHGLLHPFKPWTPWRERRTASVRSVSPAVQAVAGVPFPARRAS